MSSSEIECGRTSGRTKDELWSGPMDRPVSQMMDAGYQKIRSGEASKLN
jgi:hypothetical protein